MKKQPKRLTLNKETLRDLAARSAGEVKGGITKRQCTALGKNCHTGKLTHCCF